MNARAVAWIVRTIVQRSGVRLIARDCRSRQSLLPRLPLDQPFVINCILAIDRLTLELSLERFLAAIPIERRARISRWLLDRGEGSIEGPIDHRRRTTRRSIAHSRRLEDVRHERPMRLSFGRRDSSGQQTLGLRACLRDLRIHGCDLLPIRAVRVRRLESREAC